MLELLLPAVILLLLFVLVLYPAGNLLLWRFGAVQGGRLDAVLSIALGGLFYAALIGALSAGLQPAKSALVLRVAAIGIFALWCYKGLAPAALRGISLGVVIWFSALYLFCVLSAAFPDGELKSLSGRTIRNLTGLPIDNIISFNFSRYIVEDIPLSALEVVPNWDATSRGPLAGLLTAVFHLLLGIEERAHWLDDSPGPYLVYHCLMVFLNLQAGVAAWCLAAALGRRKSGVWTLLGLSVSAFFFINLVFTWPKFLSAAYVLSAFAVWLYGKRTAREAVLSGLLLAGGVLAHEIAILYAAPFLLYVLAGQAAAYRSASKVSSRGSHVRAHYRREILWPAVLLVLSLAIGIAPWQIFKSTIETGSAGRMAYLHLFCVTDQSVGGLSFIEAFRSYAAAHGLGGIISARLINLWYPFDIFHAGLSVRELVSEPYRAAARFSSLSFYQFIHALGLPYFVLLVIGALSRKAPSELLLLSLGALIAAVLLFGCPQTTTNHVWAYPAFVIGILGAALTMERLPGGELLFALGVAGNVVLLFLSFWLGEEAAVFLSAEHGYLRAQAACAGAAMLGLFWELMRMERDDERI